MLLSPEGVSLCRRALAVQASQASVIAAQAATIQELQGLLAEVAQHRRL